MPLDELLEKYQRSGGQEADDADDGLFPYSPVSLSDASGTGDGKYMDKRPKEAL